MATTELTHHNDQEVPDILASLDSEYLLAFKPFVKRYFKDMYCTAHNLGEQQRFDTCIRIHNNGICLVYLADNNSVVTEKKCIEAVNFKINDRLDRTKNSFSGKRKKGAQVVQSSSVICHLKCEDGTSYPVHAGVPGRLLEVNMDLLSHPGHVVTNRGTDGYICIIHPNNKNDDKFDKVISPVEYFKLQ